MNLNPLFKGTPCLKYGSRRFYLFSARIMKLTALLLTLGCLQVNATAYSQRVTLSERHVPIEKVFKEIRKQTGYLFLYTNELLQQAGRVSIQVTDVPLEEVLELCFEGQPVRYAIV
ncbi:MAG: STN domain-containing protein, partial [Daejeonella sp.]